MKLDAPRDQPDVLRSVAAAWGHHLGDVGLQPLAATDKIVAACPSAILALLGTFRTGVDVDWPAHVIVIATPPPHRQLPALAGALLGIGKATRIVAATAPPTGSLIGKARHLGSRRPPDAVRTKELVSA